MGEPLRALHNYLHKLLSLAGGEKDAMVGIAQDGAVGP
jgi:hypothetical protein